MDKKLSHTILFFGDLLSFGGLWLGYHIVTQVFIKITNQADMISYGNRVGFFIVGIGFPLLHLLVMIEHFRPKVIRKYKRLINSAVIAMVIALLGAGFVGSSWIQHQVKNAGYIYCQNASGSSTLAKSLVYTKDMRICEKLAASKRKGLRNM
jgi:hypothetical protein